MTRRAEVIVLAAILVLSVALRMAFLHLPLERDEGLYAVVGTEILHGAVPYRDVIDHKPPGVHYLYALMILLGGPTPGAIRFLTALYNLGTVLLVHLVGRQLGGAKAGSIAALLYAVVGSGPLLQANGSNTETFLLLPLTAAVHAWYRSGRARHSAWLAWSGFCLGAALMIKTVIAPLAAILAAAAFRAAGAAGDRRAGFRAVLFFATPPLVLVAFVVAWFARQGALGDFIHWNLTFNRRYQLGTPLAMRWFILDRTLPYLVEHAALWLVALVTVASMLRRRPTQDEGVFLALLAGAAVAVALPGRFYQHYFVLFLPFLSVLCGIGVSRIADLSAGWRIAGRAALLLLAAHWLAVEYPYYLVYAPEEVSEKVFHENFGTSETVARQVRERSDPGDRVLQWGAAPEINFLSDRRPPTPYTIEAFVGGAPDVEAAVGRIVSSLEAGVPRLVVVEYPEARLRSPLFARILPALQSRYREAWAEADFLVLERK